MHVQMSILHGDIVYEAFSKPRRVLDPRMQAASYTGGFPSGVKHNPPIHTSRGASSATSLGRYVAPPPPPVIPPGPGPLPPPGGPPEPRDRSIGLKDDEDEEYGSDELMDEVEYIELLDEDEIVPLLAEEVDDQVSVRDPEEAPVRILRDLPVEDRNAVVVRPQEANVVQDNSGAEPRAGQILRMRERPPPPRPGWVPAIPVEEVNPEEYEGPANGGQPLVGTQAAAVRASRIADYITRRDLERRLAPQFNREWDREQRRQANEDFLRAMTETPDRRVRELTAPPIVPPASLLSGTPIASASRDIPRNPSFSTPERTPPREDREFVTPLPPPRRVTFDIEEGSPEVVQHMTRAQAKAIREKRPKLTPGTATAQARHALTKAEEATARRSARIANMRQRMLQLEYDRLQAEELALTPEKQRTPEQKKRGKGKGPKK